MAKQRPALPVAEAEVRDEEASEVVRNAPVVPARVLAQELQ